MGFTNDNNLIKNQECTITYSGNLYQNNSEQITIVYGFGDNWDFTSEKLMTKKQNGFEVKIKMLDYNTFNFCFRNSNYEWDNNNYANYSLPIETITETESEASEETNKNDLLNVILDETKSELNYIQEFDIDRLIEEILSPLLEENVSAFTESDIDDINVDEIVTSLLNEELYSQDNVQSFEENEAEFDETMIEDFKQITESLNEQIENSLFEIASSIQSEIIEETSSIIETDLADTNISTNINNVDISIIEENNSTALTVRDEDKFVVCSRKLSQFYLIRKKIKLALCKIVFAIPRMLNRELNTNKD